ncbi:MAG: SH3 domain-containing protein [Pedobacter sp.]
MHRRNLILFLGLLLMPFFSVAKDSAESLYVKANKEFAEKKYEAAVNTYQRVLDAGAKTAAVYYNLGNAHYRLNSFASAILNYERARRLAPNDRDVIVNLALANSKITDKMEVLPELFLTRWWTSFLLLLTVQGWSMIGVLFLLTGFTGLIIYLYSQAYRSKRLSFYSGLVMVVLGICFISFARAVESYMEAHKEGVVFNGTVNVKSAPDAKQKTLMLIHEGTKLRIIDSKNDWLKVELPNGTIGWVEARTLQLI